MKCLEKTNIDTLKGELLEYRRTLNRLPKERPSLEWAFSKAHILQSLIIETEKEIERLVPTLNPSLTISPL